MIDMTGKLNNHDDYLNILNFLEKKCCYIEIFLIDGKDTNDLVEKFKKNIISTQYVSDWLGSKVHGKNKLVKIKVDKELFKYLKKFETFCKYYISFDCGDYSVKTDFGVDDIAFYDQDENLLLVTTTHEGNIFICNSLMV